MNVILRVARKNKINSHKFNTITEAYNHYLKRYSTLKDWLYYLKCAHCLLNSIKNERTMESIFRNVFDENVQLIIEN